MPFSNLDRFYRGLLLSKYFVKGWGNPSDLKRLLDFRKIVADREICFNMIPKDYPVFITKETVSSGLHIIDGWFPSPFDKFMPGLLPKEALKATFQVILPNKWNSKLYKPVCLHMAGTGDHFFWRRRNLVAKPLLKEAGIGSVIIENPYYGTRKPDNQVRSVLHNVTDIFVMGGCLILEALVIFKWCMEQGLGPLGVSGFSMGGHMASLAATNWPYPIVLVPCLSWTTASSVFTEGVMSNSIDWDMLTNQYKDFIEIHKRLHVIDEKFFMDPNISLNMTNSVSHVFKFSESKNDHFYLEMKRDSHMPEQQLGSQPILSSRKAFKNLLLNFSVIDIPKLFNLVGNSRIPVVIKRDQVDWEKLQTVHFMRSVMDECTHLSNFSTPVDTSLVIIVCAKHDAYVPRDSVRDLAQIWPQAEVRYLQAGHISAFVLHQETFRRAIKDCFERYKEKYLKDSLSSS